MVIDKIDNQIYSVCYNTCLDEDTENAGQKFFTK